MEETKFGAVMVEEIMHREVRRTDPDMSLADTARKMRDLDVGCLPVWENDELIGIITDRDVTCRAIAEARDPAITTVRDVMSQDVAFCFDDQRASEAARIMRERKVRRLPVFDHDKHMVGILTPSDLAIHTPEITGEVVRSVSTRH